LWVHIEHTSEPGDSKAVPTLTLRNGIEDLTERVRKVATA
jgi:hypothetical protein